MPIRNERKRSREPSRSSSRAPSPPLSLPPSPSHSPHDPSHALSSTLPFSPLIGAQEEARPGVLTRQVHPGTSSVVLQGVSAHPTPTAVHHIDQATSPPPPTLSSPHPLLGSFFSCPSPSPLTSTSPNLSHPVYPPSSYFFPICPSLSPPTLCRHPSSFIQRVLLEQ